MAFEKDIHKSVSIAADAQAVWTVLTDTALIKRWLSDTELDVLADWTIGGHVTSKGDWHGMPIVNKGVVVALEEGRRLAYTHWSSLSQLPDQDAYYTLIRFELIGSADGILLEVHQTNLMTPEIYGHWNFYWTMALGRIKQLAEGATS